MLTLPKTCLSKTRSLGLFTFSVLLLGSSGLSPAHAISVGVDQQAAPLMVHVANQETLSGAETFVEGMAERAVAFLADESITTAQQKEEFRKLLNTSFDMNKIARFALGRYWRTASKDQQDEYLDLFKAMVLNVYSSRFRDYGGQTFDVTNSRSEGEKDVIVSSVIKGGNQNVNVDWRVRYNRGSYKVIDVIIAGVSMGLTQRSDFSSVIQRGGGDVSVLIVHLRASTSK